MQNYHMHIDRKYADPVSGLGRENGIDAMREYLQVKSVWIDTGAVTGNPFVMR
jgi:hypothetical protein